MVRKSKNIICTPPHKSEGSALRQQALSEADSKRGKYKDKSRSPLGMTSKKARTRATAAIVEKEEAGSDPGLFVHGDWCGLGVD
jgi:hypothetical protein